jgi:uncharacterized delta-60 repeat protein
MYALSRITIAALLVVHLTVAVATDGALDPAFGSGGKVQIAAAATGAGGSNLVATDVAVQSSGKTIVAGYNDNTDCVLARLNVDGSLDTSFGGTNSFSPGFDGYGGCSFTGVAVRPDDRIVTVANQPGGVAVVSQFTASGLPDGTFGTNGAAFIFPASGDSTYVSRVVIESDGYIDVAGFYHQQSTNNNEFLFDRVLADGSGNDLFQYEFGSGNNQDDHALGVAIDPQGRYVVCGYHRGANGNYDFAAIRIQHNLYDVDPTFGSGGQTTVAFDLGGDNGDYCNAVAIFPSSGYMVLGGHSTVTVGNGTYQAASLAELDNNGNLYQHRCGDFFCPSQFTFAYNLNPSAGLTNDITRLIIDSYDTKYPQLLAIGSGFQSGPPYGQMFGIARFNFPGFGEFPFDSNFNGKGVEGVYFAERPTGIGLLTTTNYGLSGTFANGKLVVAGYTQASGGNAIAVTRLAPFDGIFKNGFDTPSY